MSADELGKRLDTLLQDWREHGLPPRWSIEQSLRKLIEWQDEHENGGLLIPRALMFTATLDDGWGHGLELIQLCAGAAGWEVRHLGLMLSPERILAACREHAPDFLGLTMLHSDSESGLSTITGNLPAKTRLLAGGPPFESDPELAGRAGVHHVSANVADFLEYVLSRR